MKPLDFGVMLGFGDDPREVLKKAQDVGAPTGQMGRPTGRYLAGEGLDELKKVIEESGVEITAVFCGFEGESYADIPTVRQTVGLVPNATRARRVEETKEIINFARAIGVNNVAAHIGFIPEDRSDPDYQELVAVLQDICDHAAGPDKGAGSGLDFSLETGQETAEVLLQFIQDVSRNNLKVNFDPANMILYGSGEPIAALKLLGKYVVGVHCKDGKWPTEEGQLGHETPLGQGDVGMDRFIATLKEIGYTGPLTIEREISGEQQIKDIKESMALLESLK